MADANSSRAQEFISLYNKIENYLEAYLGLKKHVPFWELVQRASKQNRIVERYRDDLQEYARLRNAIVHSDSKKMLAEPYDESVDYLREIYETITKPPEAKDFFLKNVFTAPPDDRVTDVIKRMYKYDFAQLPVYKNGSLMCMVTNESIRNWIANEIELNNRCNLTHDIKVSDLADFCEKDNFKIVSENTDVYKIFDYFTEFMKTKHRLHSVLITKTGNRHEMPSGIVTTWDIPLVRDLIKK